MSSRNSHRQRDPDGPHPGSRELSAELAINAGITGPMLRASGVDYDLRKVDNYGVYPRFDFRVPLGDHGECTTA